NELRRSGPLDYRPQPIVAPVRTAGPEPYTSKRQSQVIDDDDQLFQVASRLARQTLYRLAAKVHERLRLDQLDRFAVDGGPAPERAALVPFYRSAESLGQLIDDHKPEIMTGLFVLPAGVAESDDEPIVVRDLSHSIRRERVRVRAPTLSCAALFALVLAAGIFAASFSTGLAFGSLALFADDLGFCTLFDLRFELNFLDDDDRSNDRFGGIVDLNAFADLDVGNVCGVLGRQIADIDLDKVRGLCRLAKNLDLTHCLRSDRTLLFESLRLADEVDRDGHLDLFTASKAAKSCMHQTAAERVDLASLEDHVAFALTGDVERKYGVDTRIRSQHSRKIFNISRKRQILSSAAIDHDRDLAIGTKPAVDVLAALLPFFSLYNNFISHIYLPFRRCAAVI